ncbi:MAG TPA: arginine--tRNA ligase [Solirubrobacteraceae bacterium]|jgi:arginyl-tRNA synthetase
MKLLTEVQEIADASLPRFEWTLKPFSRPRTRFDLVLVAPASRDARQRDATTSLKARLESSRLIERSELTSSGQIYVRLADHSVQNAGAALERDGLPHFQLAFPRAIVVHYCDPNATKALHVGHLRNLAAGHALASTLAYLGARVEETSTVADFGRNMAEALAAIWPARDATALFDVGKADHVVGARYAEHVEGLTQADAGEHRNADRPLRREMSSSSDLADELLQGMMARRRDVAPLWREVSRSVSAAQIQTLANLGIRFDSVVYASALVERAQKLAARGTQLGVFQRGTDGCTRYETIRKGFASLSIQRSDGVPTQHALALAYWHWFLTNPRTSERTALRVLGDEWKLAAACSQELIPRIVETEAPIAHPATFVFHGMVTMNGQAVKSSRTGSLLIDDLLAWLEARVANAAASWRRGRSSLSSLADHASEVAANVALGFFLTRPLAPRIDFGLEKIAPHRPTLGWLLASAENQIAHRGIATCGMKDDDDYRFAVIQAELFPLYVQRVALDYDVAPLSRYLLHLSQWYVERIRSARVSALVTAILREGALALGLRWGMDSSR